jgi:hypothetical protein
MVSPFTRITCNSGWRSTPFPYGSHRGNSEFLILNVLERIGQDVRYIAQESANIADALKRRICELDDLK